MKCNLCGKRDCIPKENRCRQCKKHPWKRFKKDTCERCGFVPEHTSQLDVDHVNGDKRDNRPENLRTLCANCHRLKTIINLDHLNPPL